MNIILLNVDLPPIELKVETKRGRKQYIQSLQSADDGNYTHLERLVRQALRESVSELPKIPPISGDLDDFRL